MADAPIVPHGVNIDMIVVATVAVADTVTVCAVAPPLVVPFAFAVTVGAVSERLVGKIAWLK